MEQRILFNKGKQREFLDLVVKRLNCISVRGILQFGFDVKYNSLKSYYCERRSLPKGFFEGLCHVANIDRKKLRFSVVGGNFGQRIGGSKSKRF
ncbi:hypothetical protein J4218_03585 [Candidatus Pacearchaeota archaeon]|nr:hypothetical protein [Candidatus Pacearchaeota archaeon]